LVIAVLIVAHDVWTLVAALIAGGASGAWISARLTTRHDRTERQRAVRVSSRTAFVIEDVRLIVPKRRSTLGRTADGG
jgi:hypothetical protein